ncbi:DUF1659 domain-containing protein [Romboutsia maritimum]|uniref:DUF1659 domain-containing protein n=1 Tax=Romboutsia maritimum TaxID=2020948 RepID=A0A371IQ30_9FIRM|nr:DUF1659 domain-containing protein [Romboutsia maritimum]
MLIYFFKFLTLKFNYKSLLKFQTGTDPITQKVIVKTKTYSNLKPSASNDDV